VTVKDKNVSLWCYRRQ